MSVAERAAYLREELGRQEQRFARRRRRDKRKAFVLQMATVALSATITVLLGVQVGGRAQPVLANIALGLGALVTVLAALEAFFNHRGLWVNRTITVRRLEELRRRMNYQLAGLSDSEVPPEVVDDLQVRLDRIVADDQRAWLALRSVEPWPVGDADESTRTSSGNRSQPS